MYVLIVRDVPAAKTDAIVQVAVYKGLGFEERGMREMPTPWNTWTIYVFLVIRG